MFEEEDIRRPYLPWAAFDELRDEENCRYDANIGSLSRARTRFLERFSHIDPPAELSLDGLCQEINRSRFGDVLEYLARKGILSSGKVPVPIPWLHSIPKSHFVAIYAREELQSLGRYSLLHGKGASYNSFTEALSKAIGELVERYVLLAPFIHPQNKITRRMFNDKKISRALLEQTPRFFDWQRAYVPDALTAEILKSGEVDTAHIHTVLGESLTTGRAAALPLQSVLWGGVKSTDNAFRKDSYKISPRTTNGSGGGFSLSDATLSGLYELVERDSFFIFWLNRLTPRRINIDEEDPKKFTPRFFDVYRSFVDRGFEVYFLDTTTDIRIPTVTSVLLSPLPDGKKSVTVSGKCHPDPARALALSFLEHVVVPNFLPKEVEKTEGDIERQPFADNKIGKDSRNNLWRGGRITEKMDFFLSGTTISFADWASGFSLPPTDPDDMLSSSLKEFARLEREHGKAYEVFRYKARHPILEDLGYHVVKVIVPALMPLYLNETLATLDCTRLREVPKKLGLAASPVDAYNPTPHPYP